MHGCVAGGVLVGSTCLKVHWGEIHLKGLAVCEKPANRTATQSCISWGGRMVETEEDEEDAEERVDISSNGALLKRRCLRSDIGIRRAVEEGNGHRCGICIAWCWCKAYFMQPQSTPTATCVYWVRTGKDITAFSLKNWTSSCLFVNTNASKPLLCK